MMPNTKQYTLILEIDFDSIARDYPYNKEYMYDSAKEDGDPPPSITEICHSCVYTWLQDMYDCRRPVELPFYGQLCKDFETWIIERGLE